MVVVTTAPTVVLLHGAWHAPACWDHLTRELANIGHRSVAVDLPSAGVDPAGLGSMEDDLREVERVTDQAKPPLVLVGHSYGATLATVAAETIRGVVGLISVAGLLPDISESATTLIVRGRTMEMAEAVEVHDGYLSIDPAQANEIFYADCPSEVARIAVSQLRFQSIASVRTRVEATGWRTKPTAYVVCEQDRALRSSFQHQHASDRGARVITLESGHSPMLSVPAQLAATIARLGQDFLAT